MIIRIAINGFGRIGRLVLRAIAESKRSDIQFLLSFCFEFRFRGGRKTTLDDKSGIMSVWDTQKHRF